MVLSGELWGSLPPFDMMSSDCSLLAFLSPFPPPLYFSTLQLRHYSSLSVRQRAGTWVCEVIFNCGMLKISCFFFLLPKSAVLLLVSLYVLLLHFLNLSPNTESCTVKAGNPQNTTMCFTPMPTQNSTANSWLQYEDLKRASVMI